MKVKVVLEPYGIEASVENLNTPNQKFEGTVNENLIEGIFEIKYDKYEGVNAPGFPAEYDLDEEMNKYIEPFTLIDSDDPILVKKAEEITDGSHSVLLAAFCRAVNIPARVVWGCMYIPNNGGSFGQHAWNEIFMGDAGWIAVDATAQENDFLDSGHLRLGEFYSISISLNAKEIEILDYELSGSEEHLSESKKYDHFLGQYQEPKSKKVVNVVIKENNLAVDIPNKITLPLKAPDDKDRWFCTLTNKVYVTFNNSSDNKHNILKIHEMNKLIRKPDTLAVEEPVPEKFIP